MIVLWPYCPIADSQDNRTVQQFNHRFIVDNTQHSAVNFSCLIIFHVILNFLLSILWNYWYAASICRVEPIAIDILKEGTIAPPYEVQVIIKDEVSLNPKINLYLNPCFL